MTEALDELLAEPYAFVPTYAPPEGLIEMADREIDRHRGLILYCGEVAVVDIVSLDEQHEPEFNLLRLQTEPENAMDLFQNPQRYAPAEVARAVFERQTLSDDDLNRMYGSSEAA